VLPRLIESLRARGPLERDACDMAELLSESLAAWPFVPRLLSRPGSYTRTCAYQDRRFEIVLLNWTAGAVSPIHDHGGQHCWMFVLDGRLEVEDYVRLDVGDVPGYAHVEQSGARTLEAGETDLRSERFDLHRVAAAGSGRAVSLHVYAGPLRQFLIYHEVARRCETVFGSYDDVLPAYPDALPR
jgi:predicted metal-dependent enzyme (double-stranded beta helix superfamily)